MSNKREKFQAKGKIFFLVDIDENDNYQVKHFIMDEDYYLKEICRGQKDFLESYYEMNFTYDIYDMFDGKEFLNDVEHNCISDYDGHISEIFVDGYISNLGLTHDNLTQGKFLVSSNMWEIICENYDVKVNWVNK